MSLIRLRRNLGVLMISMGLAACSSTLKTAELDPETGRFDTASEVEPEEILVDEALAVQEYKRLLVARSEISDPRWQTFFRDSLENMGYFERVLDEDQLEQFVVTNGYANQVENISDLVGLHNLAGAYGKFLICEIEARRLYGYHFESELRVFDPVSGKLVFHVKRAAFNWSGLDDPLFYPVMNAFHDWLRRNEDST